MKRAVLIGINYFGSDNELAGCINDVYDMEKYLDAWGCEEYMVLVDDPDDPEHKLPNCPTRANIIAAMRDMVARTAAGDTLYVHYSGHGSQLRDQPFGDEIDRMDETICPVDMSDDAPDAGFIRDDTLREVLVDALAPGAKLRVVFDSCHSGSALDLPVGWLPAGVIIPESRAAVRTSPAPDVMFISGCMDAQTSSDATFDGRNNGALTHALLFNLQKYKGKTITWSKLCRGIDWFLKTGGYTQTSQLGCMVASQLLGNVDL